MTDQPTPPLTLADIEAIRALGSLFPSDLKGRLLALCDIAEAHLRQTAEPVVWQWRPKGSSSWMLTDNLEWMDDERREHAEIRPLYRVPPPPTNAIAVVERMREAKKSEIERLEAEHIYSGARALTLRECRRLVDAADSIIAALKEEGL